MTSSSHVSMMWTMWRIIFADEVVYFPTIDKSENTPPLFFHIWMTSWKGRGKENTFKYLLYFKHLKKPLSHLFLLSTLWDKYFLYFTSEKLLMLGKMKYFVYIPSKSKNKGHDLNPGGCTPIPALSSPSHFTMICFHMWRHRSVSPCLPQALSASGMYVFILLAQNQPLTDPHQAIR